jgi:hypothetical protein
VSAEEKFQAFKHRVLQRPRIAGIYILECASLPRGADQDAFLRTFAAKHGFSEPDVEDAEWRQAEVFREDARTELIQKLLGGGEIGHSRWDVPPPEAASFADEFLGMFGEDARFFCSGTPTGLAQSQAPSANPIYRGYIFAGGCIAIDRSLAGIFWMLDND